MNAAFYSSHRRHPSCRSLPSYRRRPVSSAFVTPAKAGVQHGGAGGHWVPAYAGTTDLGCASACAGTTGIELRPIK